MDVAHIRQLCLDAERLWREGALAEARAQAAEAVAVARAGARDEAHHALGLALTTLGWLAHELEDAGAAGIFEEALSIARGLRDDDAEHALAILRHVADFERTRGNEPRAAKLERESLALLGEALGTDHPRYFTLQERLTRAPSR